MKHNPEFAVLALWAVAIVATILVARDGTIFSYLGPVYFACAAGSVVSVRKARQLGR